MDHGKITAEYYSQWIGREGILNGGDKTHLIRSDERNKTQYGYPCQYDLYVFSSSDHLVFSYGDKLAFETDRLKELLESPVSADKLRIILSQLFNREVSHSIKFCFDHLPSKEAKAKVLGPTDYPLYLEFFKAAHPDCSNTDWVEDYFYEMADQRLCCGVFEDNKLISCTDAPGMPYMSDRVQEIGINTLPAYRNKGYAANVCILCAEEIIKSGRSPQWSTTVDNIPSQRLAEKTGFVKYADVLSLTL